MSIKHKNLLVFIAFLIILGIMQFTSPYIIGFDSYLHIKAADIIKNQGFIKEFPWAEHTILSNNYADIQLLFRIILIPFTFFSLDLGAKIASILFSAIAFAVFYWFLVGNKIKYSFFWTLLYLFTSASLMHRFTLTREMPLAIALIILTIYFLQKKRYLLLGLTSLIFALFYSGFVIQIFIILVYLLFERIFSKKFDYKIILYSLLGVFIGLIINPYFPNNIALLYTQIFKVNLISNLFNVEWKPWSLFDFIKNNILVFFYLAIPLFILIKDKKINKNKLFYLALALFFFAYTIISRRMHEYLVPFSILAAAFFLNSYFENFDRNKLKYHGNQRFPGHQKFSIFECIKILGILLLIIIASANFILLKKDIENNNFLHNYNDCADWMKNNIKKNSLIFNNAYAFPYLFFKNSDLRYTHGIDLTYSYLFDKNEFERYMEILQGTSKDASDYIIKDYNPDYVFSGKVKQDVQLFNYIVGHKENYKAVYEDEWCAVLEVGAKI
ncbi:MAG: hypothetical protein QF436_01450 [Candidatus Woesearchaeota archaeon]|jgi:hypothetical protein|nr:hypothetical protein [Candidatus Woesearchaeota archaeon]MDP7622758.1 hypothetical protein [Candidatus Woesearchaeota archaeon]HJN56434.1 hypothetical protein [Candidatus Woesearchaeota archaeon]|tara:strand:- start:36399 stop:37895 length:1497 start_codon:yes stop_codon:yes gene_type:complete